LTRLAAPISISWCEFNSTAQQRHSLSGMVFLAESVLTIMKIINDENLSTDCLKTVKTCMRGSTGDDASNTNWMLSPVYSKVDTVTPATQSD